MSFKIAFVELEYLVVLEKTMWGEMDIGFGSQCEYLNVILFINCL